MYAADEQTTFFSTYLRQDGEPEGQDGDQESQDSDQEGQDEHQPRDCDASVVKLARGEEVAGP